MTSSFPGLKSGSASLLSALRQSLMCPKCEKGPDYGSLRLSDCGHSFCGVCAVAVRGCCPFCQVATNEGSWV